MKKFLLALALLLSSTALAGGTTSPTATSGGGGGTTFTLTTVPYAASVAVDFDKPGQTISLTGPITLTSLHLSDGTKVKTVTLQIVCDGTNRALSLPWTHWPGTTGDNTAPTTITASTTGVLYLYSYTSADSGVFAYWSGGGSVTPLFTSGGTLTGALQVASGGITSGSGAGADLNLIPGGSNSVALQGPIKEGSASLDLHTLLVAKTAGVSQTFIRYNISTLQEAGDTVFQICDTTGTCAQNNHQLFGLRGGAAGNNDASTMETGAIVAVGNTVITGSVTARGVGGSNISLQNDSGDTLITSSQAVTFGHRLKASGAPAASNSGSGTCTSVTVAGTSVDGKITATCTAGQTVIVTLGETFGAAPQCFVTPIDTNAAAGVPFASTSTTQLTVTSKNTTTAAANFSYFCIQ